jgi:hypothetical protein
MSTIWTPGGERPVGRQPSPAPEPPPEREAEVDAPTDAEIAALQRELAEAPAAVVITNHCVGLFQLAALHLNQQPPKFDDAQLAIDALAAVVEGLGSRLGEDEPTLRDALAQIRLAYVQLKAANAS